MSKSQGKAVQPLVSLAYQTAVYGLSPFIQRVVVYFTIPLLTTHMGKEPFGVVAVLISMFSVFGTITNAGLPSATFRLYNESSDSENRSSTLGSSLALFIAFATMLAFTVWFAAEPISNLLFGDPIYVPTVRLVAILVFVMTLNRFVEIILRIQVRPKAKVLQDVALNAMQVSLALILVISFNLGAFGYWAGQLAGAILGLILSYWLVKGTVELTFSKQRAKELLHYGLPLVPAALGLWGLRFADRSLITASLGLSEVAVYEVGYKVGMITGLLTSPFLLAWPQFAFSRMHHDDAPRTYRNVSTVISASIGFLALFVVTFRHELVDLMAPPDYAAAAAVVPWIAFSQVAWALYPVLSIGPKIAKNTTLLAIVTFVACLVNIGLNMLLIPQIGIVGAGIATFVGNWVLAGLAYIVGNKYYAVSLDWVRLIKVLFATGITLIIVAQIDGRVNVMWQRIPLLATGLAVFPIILIAIGFVSREQLRQGLQLGFGRARKMLGI